MHYCIHILSRGQHLDFFVQKASILPIKYSKLKRYFTNLYGIKTKEFLCECSIVWQLWCHVEFLSNFKMAANNFPKTGCYFHLIFAVIWGNFPCLWTSRKKNSPTTLWYFIPFHFQYVCRFDLNILKKRRHSFIFLL